MAAAVGGYAVTVSTSNPARRVWRFFGWLASSHKRALTQHHLTETEIRFIRSFAGWLTICAGFYVVSTAVIWGVFFHVLGYGRELSAAVEAGFWTTFGMQQVLVIGGALLLARFLRLPLLPAGLVILATLAVLAFPTILVFGFLAGCNTQGTDC